MMRALAVILAIVLGMPFPSRAETAFAGQPVMGTILQVTVVASDVETARALAARAVEEARRWDEVLTTWRADGELARLNDKAGGEAVPVSRELLGALERMREFWLATGGAFDPSVAPLVELWKAPPENVEEVLARIGPFRLDTALTLQEGKARLAPGAALDAGGIGKGVALDAIAGLLRTGGAEAAFLDFGGSSQLGIGAPPQSPAGWAVAVSGLEGSSIRGLVRLRDAALSTSRALGAGTDAGPIIDPRTQLPVQPPRLATVLAPDATSAEAWSTALVVLGRSGAKRVAEGLEVLYEDDSGAFRSPGWPWLDP